MRTKNEIIFNSLYRIIHDNINKKVSPKEIASFLLGDRFQSTGELSDNTISKLRSGNSILSSKHYTQIGTSTDWSFEQFEEKNSITIELIDKIILHNKLLALYRQYVPNDQSTPNESQMFQTLISLYFFGYPNASSCFLKKDIRLCLHSIYREEKISTISKLLNTNNVLFITGGPASGKKELVKQYILTYRETYKDIGWLDCQYEYIPLRERIMNLAFIGNLTPHTIEDVKNNLKCKSSISLLIIDAPILTDEDVSFIKTFFQSLDLKIIFTTRSTNIPTEYVVLNVNDFPVEKLHELYKSWITFPANKKSSTENEGREQFNEETVYVSARNNLFSKIEFRQLCNIIDFNPMVITLIAKLVSKSPSLESFKQDILDPNIWIWKNKYTNTNSLYKSNNELLSFSSPKSATKITMILFRMLKNYSEEFLSETGVMFSVYAKEAIPPKTLSLFFDTASIQYAINCGLLIYTDSDRNLVYMPSLLVHTIWQKYPIEDIDDYWQEILKTFKTVLEQNSFSIHTLYSIITNMLYRYHFNIFVTTSFTKRGYKASYQLWNSFLVSMMHYCLYLGNPEISEQFIPFLFKCKSITSPEQKSEKLAAEKCIEDMITFHYQLYRSNNLMETLQITNIEKSSCQISVFPTRQDRSYKKVISDSIFIVAETMADLFIRWEHTITITCITDEKLLEKDNTISYILEKLENCCKILANQKYVCLYYQLIYNYIDLIYGNANNIRTINELISIFLQGSQKDEIPVELFLRFELQAFYYSLLHTFLSHLYTGTPYPEDFYSQAYIHFRYCYMIWQQHIFSWDTMWIFYTLVFFLKSIVPCQNDTVLFHLLLNEALKTFSSFVNEQLNFLDDDYKNTLLEKISINAPFL